MLYKLTDAHDRTYGGTQWGPGVTHRPNSVCAGRGPLCGPGWIHAYLDSLVAVIRNPADAGYGLDAHLWESDGEVGLSDHGLKVGCLELTTIRQVPLPELSTEQRVRCAIACALTMYHHPAFRAWAVQWWTGADRTACAAVSAERAEEAEALTAVSAARAAAQAAAAVSAERAAVWAADAAAWAAETAASAARAAADHAQGELPLPAILRAAVAGEMPSEIR